MAVSPTTLDLSIAGCRQRQARLQEILRAQQLPLALISDRRHVFYFTGFWCRPFFSPLLLLPANGPTTISVPYSTSLPAADEVAVYESSHLATLVDDQWMAAFAPLRTHIETSKPLGVDGVLPAGQLQSAKCHDLRPAIWQLRRSKDPDEIAVLRSAIAATEAAYAYARDALEPGVTEVDLFAGMHAAALRVIGEPIGEFGNDFQFNSIGGMPRRRAAKAGEIAILDVTVTVRGYSSDLSRSFVIGREPSPVQLAAHARIEEAFALVQETVRVGSSCRALYSTVHKMLDGYRGWKFMHHLGHGIGLSPHEAPRINPNWDDTFTAGDVFTIEPGLYGEELHAGLRIEDNYLLTPIGPEQLSSFPRSL